jgi:hypothetical protein
MPSYEDFADRLKVYIDCICDGCSSAEVAYEIIVVEDQCNKNVCRAADRISERWLAERGARILSYQATYANPHGFNIIEAYAKNVGIRAALYPFVCVTNCDLVFDLAFFCFLKTVRAKTFYRFMQYEMACPDEWRWHLVKKQLTEPAKCLNPDLRDKSKWTINCIAYKSGDIMLMDKTSWLTIQGFPENEVWFHSDLIVCQVVKNNNIPLIVPAEAKVFTFPQERGSANKVVDGVEFMSKAEEYLHCTTCN